MIIFSIYFAVELQGYNAASNHQVVVEHKVVRLLSYAQDMKTNGPVEIKFHSFLTSTLDGS